MIKIKIENQVIMVMLNTKLLIESNANVRVTVEC